MAKSVVKTLRINPKNEKELYDFINDKGGIKKALTFLYEHYKMSRNVEQLISTLVDQLKENIKIQQPLPAVKIDLKTTEKKNDLISKFIK